LRIKIQLKGALAWLAGFRELELELEEGSDVLRALRALCQHCPRLAGVLFDADTGDPRANFLLLLNKRDVDVLEGLSTPLTDGDVLTLIPLVRL